MSGLEKVGYPDLAKARNLFISLDMLRTGVVSWEEFQTLHLYACMVQIQKVETVRDWIIGHFKDMQTALKQIDDNASGRVSYDEWRDVLAEKGYPDKDESDAG